jgi:hypothetical protein
MFHIAAAMMDSVPLDTLVEIFLQYQKIDASVKQETKIMWQKWWTAC